MYCIHRNWSFYWMKRSFAIHWNSKVVHRILYFFVPPQKRANGIRDPNFGTLQRMFFCELIQVSNFMLRLIVSICCQADHLPLLKFLIERRKHDSTSSTTLGTPFVTHLQQNSGLPQMITYDRLPTKNRFCFSR